MSSRLNGMTRCIRASRGETLLRGHPGKGLGHLLAPDLKCAMPAVIRRNGEAVRHLMPDIANHIRCFGVHAGQATACTQVDFGETQVFVHAHESGLHLLEGKQDPLFRDLQGLHFLLESSPVPNPPHAADPLPWRVEHYHELPGRGRGRTERLPNLTPSLYFRTRQVLYTAGHNDVFSPPHCGAVGNAHLIGGELSSDRDGDALTRASLHHHFRQPCAPRILVGLPHTHATPGEVPREGKSITC